LKFSFCIKLQQDFFPKIADERHTKKFQKMMKKKWKRPDVEDDILFGLG